MKRQQPAKILITVPWTAQGLTTLAVGLRRRLRGMGHDVGLHAWRGRYQPIGEPDDRDVFRGPFERAASGCQVVIFPEVVEPAQVAWCRRRGIRTVWVPMWEYVGPEAAETRAMFDAIVCPTLCARDLLVGLGAANVFCSPWVTDAPVRQPRPIGDPPVLFHSARGVSGDIRNTAAVLVAYARYRAAGGTARLVVKSLAPLERFCPPSVLRQIASYGQDIETITRALPWSEVQDLYGRADLMVHPTRREGIGLVILEALAAGVPVVTCDAPPMNEWVVDGVNGRTVTCRPGRPKNRIHEVEVDVPALAEVLRQATQPAELARLKGGCFAGLARRRATFRVFWRRLVERLLASDPLVTVPGPQPRGDLASDLPADLLMVTYGRRILTAQTVRSIEATTDRAYRWVIVDNGSDDDTVPWLRGHAWKRPARLVRNRENRGKAAAMNQALRLATAPYLVFLDNDIRLPDGWLDHAIELLEALPEIGVAGVTFRPGRHLIVRQGRLRFRPRPTGCLAGATMVFHRALHERLGYCDEELGVYGLFDTEWCFRTRLAGLQLAYIEPPGEHLDPSETLSVYNREKGEHRRQAVAVWRRRAREYIAGRRDLHIPGPSAAPDVEMLGDPS